MKLKHALWSALGLALLVAAGCSPPPSPRQFNDRVARANRKIQRQANQFRVQLNNRYQRNQQPGAPAPQPPSVQELQQSLDRLTAVVREAKQEMAAADLPLPSSTAAALKAAHLRYLDAVLGILDDNYGRLMTAVTAGTPWTLTARPDPRLKSIDELLKEADEADKKAAESLLEAQKEFAKQHNFNLVEKYPEAK